ncbi:MAG: hypothetical protein UT48_C0001G0050 [Parcubacteria group bacterium GW2011_GWE2_39_37]|uniref:Uncharacterized protein n=1 Tax=Candidatus Falkowbacteria bacterium GW2011_GWF2_39_8 TaxID=1618642 RepID=A0A0G0Q0C2_9BACT|nr:MAG: hypothetical protein UT48_C0001G0050 [Parcubacteria group bacterium GW2011_GWE2_39_37]KKR33799.1 MAG: hypothetical protein UT64_C0003G0020 [Candidatus Falkowbacteria bacterium GW2011_GWF2_39_8]
MKKHRYGLNQLGHLTWKSYNSIKKKAMEQEFSMSGLVLSLSIAFFISLVSAQLLSIAYQTTVSNQASAKFQDSQKIYHLESLSQETSIKIV